MKHIEKIEAKNLVPQTRKKVAAYARVSLDSDRLKNSLSNQISYYSKLIQSNPDWEYKGVFADLGISGTSTNRREEFKKMIAECEKGNIDIILTKSIQRFARNTVDLLKTVRHLKTLGIAVIFEKENINSMTADGELMLSILASFAQEESRSLSENIKWAKRKDYEKGNPIPINKKVFGYRFKGDKYVIEPSEAEHVQLIFDLYNNGVAIREMERELKRRNIKSTNGKDLKQHQIDYILKNEIYIGDRMLQKFYVTDSISHNKVVNNGELPKYYIENSHEAIISKEIFEKAQAERLRRKTLLRPAYPFAKKIKCSLCGKYFVRRKKHKAHHFDRWRCASRHNKAGTCKMESIREVDLMSVVCSILELETFDADIFKEKVRFITVYEDGMLEFELTDGRKIKWQEQ